MPRKTVACIVSTLVILVLTLTGCAQRVTFQDPGLTEAVADKVGEKSNSFKEEDVAKITDLDASNCGITSLEGIAAFKSLQTINLDGNKLKDLHQLVEADLPNLKKISVVGNPLPTSSDSAAYSDVKALRGKGISVDWLTTFVATMGPHKMINDMVETADGSLLAMNEGGLFRVNQYGNDKWSFQSFGYPGLVNIVRADGLVLNSGPPNEDGPWEYFFQVPQGLTSKSQLHYPHGQYRMALMADGGYLLVGTPFGQEGSATVARLDGKNAETWSDSYDEQGSGLSGIALPDGYAILCEKGLIKLDLNGQVVKTLSFSAYGIDKAQSSKIVKAQDGYAIMGSPEGHQEARMLIVFTSDLVVSTLVRVPVPNGPNDHSMVFDFDATQDGGFVVAAHNWAFPELPANGLLLKMDASGKPSWSRDFRDYALSFVVQTSDGGFALGASGQGWTTYIIKTNSMGLVEGQ